MGVSGAGGIEAINPGGSLLYREPQFAPSIKSTPGPLPTDCWEEEGQGLQ